MKNIIRKTEKGAILFQALIALSVFIVFSPMLYKHMFLRKQNLENMTVAKEMLNLKNATDNYISMEAGNFADGIETYSGRDLVTKFKQYGLSYGFRTTNQLLQDYKILVKTETTADNLSITNALIIAEGFPDDSPLNRTFKIARKIGKDAGIVEKNDNIIQGVNKDWYIDMPAEWNTTIFNGSLVLKTGIESPPNSYLYTTPTNQEGNKMTIDLIMGQFGEKHNIYANEDEDPINTIYTNKIEEPETTPATLKARYIKVTNNQESPDEKNTKIKNITVDTIESYSPDFDTPAFVVNQGTINANSDIEINIIESTKNINLTSLNINEIASDLSGHQMQVQKSIKSDIINIDDLLETDDLHTQNLGDVFDKINFIKADELTTKTTSDKSIKVDTLQIKEEDKPEFNIKLGENKITYIDKLELKKLNTELPAKLDTLIAALELLEQKVEQIKNK